MKTRMKCIYKDALVAVWRNPATGKLIRQGKRVGKACPMSYDERRVYVKEGGVSAVAYLVAARNVSVTEGYRILLEARKSGTR